MTFSVWDATDEVVETVAGFGVPLVLSYFHVYTAFRFSLEL